MADSAYSSSNRDLEYMISNEDGNFDAIRQKNIIAFDVFSVMSKTN